MIAESPDWFKAAMQFCLLDFTIDGAITFTSIKAPGLNDLMNLTSIGGVVPLNRVSLLSEVTKNTNEIDWRLIRAMAMIDSAKEQLASKQMLVEIYETFQKSEVRGIMHLFQKSPQCLKFFLFELFFFSDEENHEPTLCPLSTFWMRD